MNAICKPVTGMLLRTSYRTQFMDLGKKKYTIQATNYPLTDETDIDRYME